MDINTAFTHFPTFTRPSAVANAVQANLLAATTGNPEAVNQIYNVAVGDRTTLNELFDLLRNGLLQLQLSTSTGASPSLKLQLSTSTVSAISTTVVPTYRSARPGDVAHSQADISKACRLLGYEPTHPITHGLDQAFPWYVRQERSTLQNRPRHSPFNLERVMHFCGREC